MAQVGDKVLYSMTLDDCEAVRSYTVAAGAALAVSNEHQPGQQVSATVVRTWGDTPESAANLRLHIDGNFDLWKPSAEPGEGLGRFIA